MHSCSVIIPTLNAGHLLADLVNRLREQATVPDEIIVIDSSSTDNTVAEAIRLGCTTISIPRLEFNHGGTRNAAALKAKGDILIFLTQDALPVDHLFLEELLRPIIRENVAATYARQIPNASARAAEKFARAFNYPDTATLRTKSDIPLLGIKAYFFSNVASAIRKDFFLKNGMFRDDVIMNEDMLFCAKLLKSDYSIKYCAGSKVYHSHNYSPAQTFQRYFDIGVFYSRHFKDEERLKIKSTGKTYSKNLFVYIIREKKFGELMFYFIETLSKFLGFYIGNIESYLPINLKKIFSLHKSYWSRDIK